MRAAIPVVAMLLLAGCGTPGDTDDRPQVRFETTLGDFTVELWRDKAPITVENILKYVDDDFYDGLTFHRIAPGFVVQGGGFLPDHETRRDTRDPIVNEASEDVKNEQWTLSMARTSDPDSATSQFFINLEDNPALDKNPNSAGYAVFGRVIAGFDTIEAMTEVEPGQSFGAGGFFPKEPIVIESAARVSGVASGTTSPPEPAALVADAITPGTWNVTDTEDSMLFWVHNDGEADGEYTFSIDAPEGWSIEFDEPSGTVAGDAVMTSMARITVPEGTSGSHELALSTGGSTTMIDVTVELGSPVSSEGDAVEADYRGTCTTNGDEFDAGTFPLTLGGGRAIKGFDLGLVGVADGESLVLVLPEDLGYGPNGGPCAAEDPSDLTFEITLHHT